MPDENESFELTFLIPDDTVLQSAHNLLDSSDSSERDLAKTLIDVVDVAKKTKRDYELALEQKGNCDLGKYFDYEIEEAAESAEWLRESTNEDVRTVAVSVIDQSKAIRQSKESFLREAKKHFRRE